MLALLPTATDNILNAIPVEEITRELQARKSEKLSRSAPSSELAPSDIASTSGDTASSTFIHASQQSLPADQQSETAPAPPSPSKAAEVPAQANGQNKSKVQLWNDLKITSLTRSLTLLYTLSLLTLLTRIQLNLLGRRNYLSSVVSLASPPPSGRIALDDREDPDADAYGDDFDTNRKYLTFSWWLLHRGWRDISNKVEEAVRDVFAPLAPRDSLSFSRMSSLTMQVRRRVEGATSLERRSANWLKYLLPPSSMETHVLAESGVLSPSDQDEAISPNLRRLLDETSDLIESPLFTSVLSFLLDAAFSHLIDTRVASEAFHIPPSTLHPTPPANLLQTSPPFDTAPRITELADNAEEDVRLTQAKLATVLAAMTRQAHAIGAGALVDEGMETSEVVKERNEYLNAIESVRELEGFAAVVYSSNFEVEGVALGGLPAEASAVGSAATTKPPTRDGVEAVTPGAEVGGRLESAWAKAFGGAK